MQLKPGKHIGRGIGAFFFALLTNLAVFQHPPATLDEAWQPLIQALLVGVGVHVQNQVTKSKVI